jgi:hypothetical protein
MRRLRILLAAVAAVLAPQLLAASSASALVSNGSGVADCAGVTWFDQVQCEAQIESGLDGLSAGGGSVSAGGGSGSSPGGNGVPAEQDEEVIVVVSPPHGCNDPGVICVPLGKDNRAPRDVEPDLDHGHGGRGNGGGGRPSCKGSSGGGREGVCKPATKEKADKKPPKPKSPEEILKDDVSPVLKCGALDKSLRKANQLLDRLWDDYGANPSLDTPEKRDQYVKALRERAKVQDAMDELNCEALLKLT